VVARTELNSLDRRYNILDRIELLNPERGDYWPKVDLAAASIKTPGGRIVKLKPTDGRIYPNPVMESFLYENPVLELLLDRFEDEPNKLVPIAVSVLPKVNKRISGANMLKMNDCDNESSEKWVDLLARETSVISGILDQK